ncbi:hypothetical protein BRARA_C00475 [Brassica rapa]|uniref:RBR-type E3 ubiquitin transferase n=1 Tax=Brassica campestris TaxID=3711 RepID=A0A397ZRS0_BRACM|nr:hypothetical protein BRARA_C00475 [Brassica rapa]
MDSDDYYMESGEEDLYSDGADDYNDGADHDDDTDDTGFLGDDDVDSSMISSPRSHMNYVVLKEEDIRRQQESDIAQVSMILSLSKVEASVLLLHYHWNVGKVNDEWFADERRVRTSAGLEGGPVIVPYSEGGKVACGICFDYFCRIDIVPIMCGHAFCSTCWTSYISIAINDGPGCLMQKCPEPSCPVAVGRDMVEKLASFEAKDKYDRYFLRSYVEENKKTKWCPAPGCEHAIEFSATGTGSSYDVSCLCSHSFCWNCTQDAHRPVDCDRVSQWIRKNSVEAENTKWILDNSKPCPKCKRPIEKNRGCMHMSCTPPCRHQFCWLCLGAWSEHGEGTGGPYTCNRYSKAKGQGLHDEAEMKREMAKHSLEKYTHYYERWAGNQTSRQKAIGDLEKFLSVDVMKLSDKQCIPETELGFITDAWLQIIECRRVLKWTYAYGYYLLESEQEKRQFFEYMQGEAESGLERLHKCVELESEVFQYPEDTPKQDFKGFRTKLTTLTSVTKTHFETLVKALENDLSDVGFASGVEVTTLAL